LEFSASYSSGRERKASPVNQQPFGDVKHTLSGYELLGTLLLAALPFIFFTASFILHYIPLALLALHSTVAFIVAAVLIMISIGAIVHLVDHNHYIYGVTMSVLLGLVLIVGFLSLIFGQI
jgi:hypothetical protein